MKCVAFTLLAVFCALVKADPPTPSNIPQYESACINESGVDPAIAKQIRNGDLSMNDEKAKCFAKCFLEKIGFYREDHTEDMAIEDFLASNGADRQKVKAVLDQCKSQKGSSACDTVWQQAKCFHEKMHGQIGPN